MASTEKDITPGKKIIVKAFVRKYEGKAQIFGAILDGYDVFDMEEGDTVMIACGFITSLGVKVVDNEKWNSGMSRQYLMNNFI